MQLARRHVVLAVVLAVVLLVGLVVFLLWPRPTSFERAVSNLPESVLRASYTDWTLVADQLPATDLSSAEEIDEFLGAAFEQDLTTASALSVSFEALSSNFGITPLDATWEVYGQGREGSVDLLRLKSDVDLDALEERFADLGYTEPSSGPGSAGVWVGTPELVAMLDEPFSTLQENLAIVPSERILVMSDHPSFVASVVSVISGDGPSLESVSGVSELVSVASSPTVAVLWADDFACEDLAMSQAGPGDVSEGSSLISSAGGVHPLEGLVMAQQPDSTLTVGMLFASDDQASDDLQPRADLASGPAPGQGGTFPERFTVRSAEASDRMVTMTFDPVEGPLLGDLGQGPVLFATC